MSEYSYEEIKAAQEANIEVLKAQAECIRDYAQKLYDKCLKDYRELAASQNINNIPSGFDGQPLPKRNDHEPVWKSVIQDMWHRHQKGVETYGVPLQPFNGRDALWDAYEEALDLAVYLRQAIEERNAGKT